VLDLPYASLPVIPAWGESRWSLGLLNWDAERGTGRGGAGGLGGVWAFIFKGLLLRRLLQAGGEVCGVCVGSDGEGSGVGKRKGRRGGAWLEE